MAGGSKKAVDRYQEKLQERVIAIETEFDSALLFVAGGSFTVSVAIVSTFDSPFVSVDWLMTAWGAWTACLLLLLAGHQISLIAHKRVIRLVGEGEYDETVLFGGWANRAITPINIATFILLVLGLVTFGKFTYDNTTKEADEHQAQAQEAGLEAHDTLSGEQGNSNLADQEQTKEVSHDRETQAPTDRETEAPGPEARGLQQEGAADPVSAQQGESTERPAPDGSTSKAP